MNFSGEAFRVESIDDGFYALVFDLKGESVNKFSASVLAELAEVVAQLGQQRDIKGLMLTSAKKVFVVGADITEFTTWFAQPDEVFRTNLIEIHKTFAALEDLPFPTVAAINGYALGGGFEVALAVDYRVMANSAKVGLPEVKLGIFPGWGGTIRLPRLIGLDNALEWIGSGNEQSADDALKQGAVDAVVETDNLQNAALQVLRGCVSGAFDYQSRREEKRAPIKLNEVERSMVFSVAQGMIAQKAGPNYPAPLIALGCIEKHCMLHRDDSMAIEVAGFMEAARTEAAANLVGLFLNDQVLKRAVKAYAKSARHIGHAAVLGAGIMGGGIAYQAALRGTSISMKDIKSEQIDLGLREAKNLLLKRVDRGRLNADQMADTLGRIQPTLSYGDVGRADIVVEAVVENQTIKETVIREVEEVVTGGTVIASNTSTISISKLGEALEQPQRFCGMHFFNPVPVMPLVEVIRGTQTDEATIATTVEFARSLGKNPIVVNDCPGFLVNRILFPYLNAFNILLRDGADFQRIDKIMERFGWPMGPAYLLDVVGIDTAHHAAQVLAAGYPDRMGIDFKSATEALFENKRLGQKSNSGFYCYQQDKKGKLQKSPDNSVAELLAPIVGKAKEFSDKEIIERMMIPMCLESVRCLEDNIVDSPVAVDMGLVWGIGFPPFRGGALRYIESIGINAFCELAQHYGSLGAAYRPTEGLLDMAAKGGKYFGGQS